MELLGQEGKSLAAFGRQELRASMACVKGGANQPKGDTAKAGL